MSLFDRITPKDQPGNNAPGAASNNTNSLFGSTAPNSGNTNSLFGNTATANNNTNSLFGSTAPNSGNANSLFGNTATANNNTNNLFGNVAAAKSNTSNLFGNTTQDTNSNSLFGNTTTNNASTNGGNAAASNNNTNSLFGAGAGAQPAANNMSLFNPNSTTNGNGQSGTALDFGSPAPQPAYFDALIQRGRKRQTEENIGAFGEIPQLQLGLQDISRKVRNLGQGGPSAGLARGSDARAHYLLSASGVNTSRAIRDLDDLADSAITKPQGASDQLDLTYPSDVKQTLARKYQSDFERMVDTHIQKAQDDFNRMIDEQLHGVDWGAQRQRIYEHFGLKKPQDLGESSAADDGLRQAGEFGRSSRRSRLGATSAEDPFGVSGLTRSVIGTPGPRGARSSVFSDVSEKMLAEGLRPAPEDRVLRMKQQKYIDRVKDLNVARSNGKLYPILQKLSEVEAEPSNEDTSMLVHAYKALISITGEDSNVATSDPSAVKERQYATGYLDDNSSSNGSSQIRKRILNGSRQYLESHFYVQLEATINKNPKDASVGGTPTAIAKVKGYVRIRAARKELGSDLEVLQQIDDVYCWPVVFYLLRSGMYNEALEYVETASAFKHIDRAFIRYLRAYVTSDNQRLPNDMQTAINNEYSQRSRLAPEQSVDPFRMICYKIVGRCELHKRHLEGIASDVMDYLWFQFAFAREYTRVDELAHEAFGLEELRHSFKELGERFFGPGSDVTNAPTMWFFIQILGGMFEKGVADLYAHNYVSAIHFAIALDFYGLLRVGDTSNTDELLTYTTRQQAQISFGSMIGLYTRDFRTANATAAVDYLTLICLNGGLPGELGKRQRDICYQALTEVALETREFAELLGDARSDGQRIKGTIEQRLRLIGLENEQDLLRHITLVAARTAEEQGRVTDAALCFHLAEDYDKVIQIVSGAVSLALTTELGEQPARLTPLKPRTTQSQGGKQQQQQQEDQLSGLSLTAVDDPITLARNMMNMYQSSQTYYSKIKGTHLDSCRVLLQLVDARNALENRSWPEVIDAVTSSRLLPLEANNNMSAIRHAAQAFNQMPSVVARTVGYVMLWTVLACSNNVVKLRNAEFETAAQQGTIQRCVQTSRDVMTFAGLIRFQLPGRVWEALARVGGELGSY